MRVLHLIVLNLLLSVTAHGAQANAHSQANILGCADCFNFVAPQVIGAENISTPAAGLIVFDSAKNRLGGYSGSNWLRISENNSVRNIYLNGSINATDDIVTAYAASGALTVQLPMLSGVTVGKEIVIKKIDSSSNAVTVLAGTGELIDGSSSIVLSKQSLVAKLVSTGTGWVNMYKKPNHPPTFQVFSSGSGTYIKPAGVSYIRVKMVGGGGGGSGSSIGNNVDGGQGGDGYMTSFGSSLLSAVGGSGGTNHNGASGGAPGNGSISGVNVSGIVNSGFPGVSGTSSGTISAKPSPGAGGASHFGGGAAEPDSGTQTGVDAVASSGSGGSGGGVVYALQYANAGAGGGGGGYVDAVISYPNSSYFYSVGSGGAGGAAGISGVRGGSGGCGKIIVEEYY